MGRITGDLMYVTYGDVGKRKLPGACLWGGKGSLWTPDATARQVDEPSEQYIGVL